MDETQHSVHASSPTEAAAFRYDLNAFTSAVRSVTFVMQAEFSKALSFNIWYSEKQEQMRNDEIMRFFHDQRTVVIHQRPIYPHGRTMVTFTDYLMANDSGSLVTTKADGTYEQFDVPSESAPLPPLLSKL